jgi:DNA repair protein RadC
MQEVYGVIAVNNNNRPVGIELLSIGGQNHAVASVKLTFAWLFSIPSCSGFVVFHNHTTNSVEPSQPDIAMAKAFSKVANIMEMRFIDSIIVTEREYYSFHDDSDII